MTLVDLTGSLAGFLTTIAFIPQVIKTWRSRSAADISLIMFALFTLGVLLWLLYGIALGALPIILANSITLILAASILVMKIRDNWQRYRQRVTASRRGL